MKKRLANFIMIAVIVLTAAEINLIGINLGHIMLDIGITLIVICTGTQLAFDSYHLSLAEITADKFRCLTPGND